jgi:hypothetical protein
VRSERKLTTTIFFRCFVLNSSTTKANKTDWNDTFKWKESENWRSHRNANIPTSQVASIFKFMSKRRKEEKKIARLSGEIMNKNNKFILATFALTHCNLKIEKKYCVQKFTKSRENPTVIFSHHRIFVLIYVYNV